MSRLPGLRSLPRTTQRIQYSLKRSYATHREKDFLAKTSTGPTFSQRLKSGLTFAFTTAFVLGLVGLTGLGLYAIGLELFSESGDTKLFNRSLNLIQNDLYCQKMLQCSYGNEQLSAYGESFSGGNRNGWGNRNRPAASMKRVEKGTGNELHFMRYYVESLQKQGVVQLEALKDAETKKTSIRSLSLLVDGERHYIVAPPRRTLIPGATKKGGFLGVNWGTK